jgi:hypothetical protein
VTLLTPEVNLAAQDWWRSGEVGDNFVHDNRHQVQDICLVPGDDEPNETCDDWLFSPYVHFLQIMLTMGFFLICTQHMNIL